MIRFMMIIPYAIIIHINYSFHIILTCCKSNNNHNYNNHHDFNGLNNQISHDSYRTKSMRIYDKKSKHHDIPINSEIIRLNIIAGFNYKIMMMMMMIVIVMLAVVIIMLIMMMMIITLIIIIIISSPF